MVESRLSVLSTVRSDILAVGEFDPSKPVCRWPNGWEGQPRHVTIDNIVVNKSRTHILLVERAKDEIEGGFWALIGGYLEHGMTLIETVEAESREEARIQRLESLALFRIVDNPNRDAGNVSCVFESVVGDREEYGEVQVADPDGGVVLARWFPIDQPPQRMAFDHAAILTEYLADPTTYPLGIFISH